MRAISTNVKLLAIMVVLGAIFVFVVLWSSHLQNQLLEQNLARERRVGSNLVEKVVYLGSAPLQSFTNDYSRWDDMVQFVVTRDHDWAKINVEQALSNFAVDAVWICDTAFTPIYSVDNMGDSLASTFPLSAEDRDSIKGRAGFHHFFARTKWGLIEIRQAPIQPTDDTLRQTPAKGHFVVGKLWSASHLALFSELIGSQLGIEYSKERMDSLVSQNLDDATISIYSPLEDLRGRTTAYLVAKMDLAEWRNFRNMLRTQLGLIVAFLLVVQITLAFVFYYWIGRPLVEISRGLIQDCPELPPSLLRQNSEFGNLARLISESVEQKRRLEEEIADRKLAEDSLRRSETKFRTLYDSTSDAVMLLDEKGYFDCNQATLAIFGCGTREEFCSRHWGDLSPSKQPCGTDSLTLANQQIATAMQSGSNRFEWIHKRVDTRKSFYAEVLLNAMELDGRPVVQAVVRDITERKRVENALRDSETEHRMLFDNAGVGITYCDLEGRVLMLNALAATQLGGKPEGFVGRTIDEILPLDVAATFHASVDMLTPTNTSADSENMIPSSIGPRWHSAKYTGIFEPNGMAIGVQIVSTDITDRKRAEDDLLKLSQAIEQSPLSVVITDVFGGIEYVNHKFCELTGYTCAEVIGQNPRILGSGLTPKETYDQMWSTIGAGLTWNGELRNRKKNGEFFWNRASIFAIKNSAGKTTHYIGLEEDITEQKRVEEERSRFTSVIDEAPESIAILHADGSIMYVNHAFEKISGVASGRAIGHYYEALARKLYANRDYHIPWDLVQAGESRTETIAYHGDDGGLRLMDQSISSIRSQSGEIINYVVFNRDVTEERELEIRARWSDERLRLSIDGMVDGLTLWDASVAPDGSVVQDFVCSEANPAALRMLGRERQTVLGRSVQELAAGQTDYDLHDVFRQVHDKGQPAIIEHAHFLRDESKVVLTISVWAIGTGVACHMHDVTQRLDLETQLRQAQKLEAVGSLAAGIAHEINTPIQFVGDNIRFLADSFSGLMNVLDHRRECREKMVPLLGEHEELQQLRDLDKQVDIDYLKTEIPLAVEQSLEGVSRVSTIVRAMKDFSHPDEREMVLADVNQMLDTTLTVARNEIKYVADVTKDFAPDLPAVECFRNDLNQVFLNLLVNAAHAIGDFSGAEEQGRGTITVATRRDGDEVVVSITDTGGGIPEGIRDRIFDHFFTTKAVGKGTGQGLSIARSIVVEKHKGAITFDSEIGKGTTFHIHLPIAKKEVEHAETLHPVRG